MKILIIIFLFLCVNIYSQGWNAIDTTDVPLNAPSGTAERISLFGNHYGIHLLKTVYSGTQQQVKYYRLKSTGESDTSGTLDTYGDFPNITGDENILYAVYRKSDTVKVQKSTNGGSNWSLAITRLFSNGGANCNGMDAAYSASRGLYIVWSEKVGNKYESYFARFDGTNWQNFISITNTTGVDSGGFPTVTTSSVSGVDRAHVSINTGTSDLLGDNFGRSYSRDYNFSTSTWSSPIGIIPADSVSKMDKLIATGSNIHSFFYNNQAFPRLKYRRSAIPPSSWGNESEVKNGIVYSGDTYEINVTKTVGDTLHVFYVSTSNGLWHKKKYNTASSWSSAFDVSAGGSNFRDIAVTSVSSDLFVMWTWGSLNYRYRQYDANPLTPANFASTTYNNHPKLIWTANSEPDLNYYEIWRQFVYDPKHPESWILISTTTQANFVDNDVVIGNGSAGDALYKIRAKDINNHLSGYTNTISFDFQDLQKQAYSSSDEIKDFSISQNYPNPFNPSTKITYALPEDAIVQIKIYDMLGTEVADLVNETKPAGVYETTFDASNLSSGIYIYRITALNGEKILFSQSKQMLLLK